jgi:hypothetical protein
MARKRIASTPVPLLEAATDPRLLGVRLYPRQAELLRLVEENPVLAASCGRQGGKTYLAAIAVTANVLLRPDLDEVAGTTTRHAVCIANSREHAALLLAYVRQLVERSPLLRAQLRSVRDDRLTFAGNRVLIAAPCQDRLVRGIVASMVVLDEAGHFVSETFGPRTLERVWTAIRPALTIFGEAGRTLAVSTPGEAGDYFAKLHERAASGDLPGAVAFSATTKELNPEVSDDFLEQERLLLGEAAFAREYEARWQGGVGSFLEEDLVRDAVGRYQELPRDRGFGWVVGFDPSFASDPSAAVVVGRDRENRDHLLVARVERWQPKRSRKLRRAAKSEAQRQEVQDLVLDGVARLSALYLDAPVVVDQHLSQVVRDGLRRRGVSQVIVQRWSGPTLTEAFRAVRAHLLADKISLPADDDLVRELCRVRSRLRSGQAAIEIPRTTTSHCDTAVALASAVLRLETKGIPRPGRTWSAFQQAGVGVEDPRHATPWRSGRRNRRSAFGQGQGLSAARLARDFGERYTPGETRPPRS